MEGENILYNVKTKPVKIEHMHVTSDDMYFGQCVIKDNYKLTKLKDSYRLIDLNNDNNEEFDIKEEKPEVYMELKDNIVEDNGIIEYQKKRIKQLDVLKAWGKMKKPEQTSMITFSKEALIFENTLEMEEN
jgi:hypothetical protein